MENPLHIVSWGPPPKNFTGFQHFLLAIGGIPAISTYIVIFVIILVSLLLSVTKLSKLNPFDYFFHKKIFYKPIKNNFVRNWIQYYFLSITYGEVILVFWHIVLCIIWFIFPNLEDFIPYFSIKGSNMLFCTSKAFGRVALFNYLLVLFPAHRFSVIQLIFGVGFEKSLKYHKLIGYLSFFCIFMHFLLCYIGTVSRHESYLLFLWNKVLGDTLPGVISGLAALVILVTSIDIFRRHYYTLFYYIHLSMGVITVVFLIFHRNYFTLCLMGIGVVFTIVDALYRVFFGLAIPAKIVDVKVFNEFDTIRLDVEKPIGKKHQTGQFMFLWTSKFSLGRPFTLKSTSSDPTQKTFRIFMKKRGKFTSHIHRFALNSPERLKGMVFRVDGVYGTKINLGIYNNFVFVSENGCAEFGFLREIYYRKLKVKPVFIWVISDLSYLKLFDDELQWVNGKYHIKIFVIEQAARLAIQNVDKVENEEIKIIEKVEIEEKRPLIDSQLSGKDYLPKFYHDELDFKDELRKITSVKVGVRITGSDEFVMKMKDSCFNSKKRIHVYFLKESW